MNRQQKEAVVAEFKDLFSKSAASFVVNYRGLSVQDVSSLRGMLRESGGNLKVTKARLMKIAAEGIEGIDSFREDFKDQIGIVFALEDVPAVAKNLVEFSKDHKSLDIISGFFESKQMSKEEIAFFASLPSKDVLLAQLARGLMAPITNLARVLNMPIQQLAVVLRQVAEKG